MKIHMFHNITSEHTPSESGRHGLPALLFSEQGIIFSTTRLVNKDTKGRIADAVRSTATPFILIYN